MIAEEDYKVVAGCPPDLAFARIERRLRNALKKDLTCHGGHCPWDHSTIEYMNCTLAAAQALGLDFLDRFTVADTSNATVEEIYQEFLGTVESYITRLHIRIARGQAPLPSVAVDKGGKERIRSCGNEIKAIVAGSAVETSRKKALMKRLNAFLADVDRGHTAMPRFGEFFILAAETTDEAGRELAPVWELIRRIAAILGVRNDAGKANPPGPLKNITPAKLKLPPPSKVNDHYACTDDDIPF